MSPRCSLCVPLKTDVIFKITVEFLIDHYWILKVTAVLEDKRARDMGVTFRITQPLLGVPSNR
jgi:hypothetical protein